MSSEEADEPKGGRIHSGASLNTPETWEHKQYRLTITVLDTFDYENDDLNVIATTIYRHMRSRDDTPDDLIFGTVYMSNETINDIIDFYNGGSDIYLQTSITS
ncbi:MAG: hypothetical protein ACKPKO_16125 [Candidatus Fonsibacter sp.]